MRNMAPPPFEICFRQVGGRPSPRPTPVEQVLFDQGQAECRPIGHQYQDDEHHAHQGQGGRRQFQERPVEAYGGNEEVHADRFGREAQVCLYMNELLLLINRVAYEQKHPVSVHEETALYQNLLLYIEAHLEEDLSLERLAQTFYVSRYHVAHTFTDHIGISIHQYITRKRLEASRAAILAGEKISDTYLRYGFRDYSSFFRAFRKEYGISPKEFRMFSESASDKSAPDTRAQSKRQLRPQE
mgnify:CR=1 FL=1